jgi:hypothetical protein
MPTFYNVSTWRNPHALSRTQDRHRPDFFAVPLADRVTPKRIAERGRFSAVFTDDLFVLYADLERHPVLEPFAFKSLEPHTLAPTAGKEREATAEMQRVALQHPAGQRVREKLWKQAMDGKDYVAAERHADELLRAHPGDPVGLFMKASVLEQTERCAAAMAIFAEIHPDLAPESQRKVRRHQGSCSYLDRDFRSAYAAFREGINPYRDGVEPEYLYQYAFVAAIEGGPAEALRALDMLAFLVDPADQSLVEKAAALRATVESDEFR